MNLLRVFLLSLTLSACDRPECKNTDPIIEKNDPDSREYRAELSNQLARVNNKKLTWWVAAYCIKHNIESVDVYVQGDGLCAKTTLDITHTKGLNNFKNAKGGGYKGAELKGVKYHIDTTDNIHHFVLDEVAWIAD